MDARYLAALENTEAAGEPLYLWLAAHHGFASDDNALAIRLAEQGRATLVSRKTLKVPHCAWSIAETDRARNQSATMIHPERVALSDFASASLGASASHQSA